VTTPLRVQVLIDSLARGGAETLLAEFAQGARAQGLEIDVAHLRDQTETAARLRALGIEPQHLPVTSLAGPAGHRAVRAHLAARRPDLVHTHLGTSDVVGSLAARSLGIPCVSTLHVMDWLWLRAGRDRVKLRFAAAVRRRCAARVIAVSAAARASYLAQGWDRADHVVAVHNGVVDRAAPGAGGAIRRELGIEADELVLAMVSVLRGGKGHLVAADAVRALAGRFPRLRLVIVGEGPERAVIERATADLADRVLFAGFRDDVQRLLDAADVLVHPSSFDAFPTALLEAMAAGVPVIATRVGGIPEIVEDGHTGLLLPPPANAEAAVDPRALVAALTPLLGDPERRRRLGAAGRRRFETHFSADRWLDRLMPIYEAALAG
jgi:glycosyltransferase involved in cell wall biosynthesis